LCWFLFFKTIYCV